MDNSEIDTLLDKVNALKEELLAGNATFERRDQIDTELRNYSLLLRALTLEADALRLKNSQQ